MKAWDVIIIGAGASGLMAAAQCASRRGGQGEVRRGGQDEVRSRRVLVLEHARECGRKVRITGHGRCNATNLRASAVSYVCANPHFVKSALARYKPNDFLNFLDRRNVPYQDEGQGRIFTRSAQEVAEVLRSEALEQGAEVRLGVLVRGVRQEGEGFFVDADSGPYGAKSVIVAAGGLAWPQVGATGLGYEIAKFFGLGVTPLRPGLAPLMASPELKDLCADQAGVSLPVRITLPGVRGVPAIEESLLFTHQGLSGPAVLDASLWWSPGRSLALDLLPGVDLAEVLAASPRMDVANVLGRLLPKRLARALCARHGWAGQVAAMSAKAQNAMAGTLHAWPFAPAGTAGFNKAEVCLGGVDTARISSKTMECRDVPGLFFTGEVLDVTGRLGGYNLQWAWSSGFAAGQFA